MLKWFSLSGIAKETKRIRWPKTKEMTKHTVEVLLVVAFFALFFVASEFVITFILRLIGVGA